MTGQSALLLPPDQAVAAISATIVEELRPALERLEEFKQLHDDWDSYGAVPITSIAIDSARELAAEIVSKHALVIRPADYSFEVIPTPDGGVQLEWGVGSQHLEIAVNSQGSLAYLFVTDHDGQRKSSTAENVTRETVVQLAEDMLRHHDG